MIPVFVYGTLKRGGAWSHLLSTSDYLGSGTTFYRYPLILDGLPFLLDEVGGKNVEGELYNVTTPVLRTLDALEGHPTWYRRKSKPVQVDGNVVDAYIYFLIPEHYSSVGNWKTRTYHSVFPVPG